MCLHKSFHLSSWHSAHIAYRGCKFSFKWKSLLDWRCTFSVNSCRKTSRWWSCHHWWVITILWWQTAEEVKWEQSQGKTWKEWQVLYIWHCAFDLMSLLTSFCFKVYLCELWEWSCIFRLDQLQSSVDQNTGKWWELDTLWAWYSSKLTAVFLAYHQLCFFWLSSSLQVTQMGILDL